MYGHSAYRGRVLSFFLVALGVSYPVGSLVQGPVANRIGVGWTTAGAALLLGAIVLTAVALAAASPGGYHRGRRQPQLAPELGRPPRSLPRSPADRRDTAARADHDTGQRVAR